MLLSTSARDTSLIGETTFLLWPTRFLSFSMPFHFGLTQSQRLSWNKNALNLNILCVECLFHLVLCLAFAFRTRMERAPKNYLYFVHIGTVWNLKYCRPPQSSSIYYIQLMLSIVLSTHFLFHLFNSKVSLFSRAILCSGSSWISNYTKQRGSIFWKESSLGLCVLCSSSREKYFLGKYKWKCSIRRQ